ncbi:MAG: FIG00511731: hypothetical protein, partial [uncultured Blastococcus sp.]
CPSPDRTSSRCRCVTSTPPQPSTRSGWVCAARRRLRPVPSCSPPSRSPSPSGRRCLVPTWALSTLGRGPGSCSGWPPTTRRSCTTIWWWRACPCSRRCRTAPSAAPSPSPTPTATPSPSTTAA